jgi:predicted phosphate transport protein (TIGR00153 family)
MPWRRLLKASFLPREQKFFDLFEEGSANLLAAAHGLRDMATHYDEREARAAQLAEFEHRGDSITHRIMEQLHLTFVTPLDREDIVALTHSLDDMVDFIEGVAGTLVLYKIRALTPSAIKLIELVVKVAEEVATAVPKLRHRRDLKSILHHCVEINRLENEADEVLRVALADLFENGADAVDIIKWREIYEQLESSTDRGEDISDVLEGLVLKHA